MKKYVMSLGLVVLASVSSVASAEEYPFDESLVDPASEYAVDFWTCRYQGKSGSTYFATDQVREKAFNQAYSQCVTAKDTPCKSAGCDKH